MNKTLGFRYRTPVDSVDINSLNNQGKTYTVFMNYFFRNGRRRGVVVCQYDRVNRQYRIGWALWNMNDRYNINSARTIAFNRMNVRKWSGVGASLNEFYLEALPLSMVDFVSNVIFDRIVRIHNSQV